MKHYGIDNIKFKKGLQCSGQPEFLVKCLKNRSVEHLVRVQTEQLVSEAISLSASLKILLHFKTIYLFDFLSDTAFSQ